MLLQIWCTRRRSLTDVWRGSSRMSYVCRASLTAWRSWRSWGYSFLCIFGFIICKIGTGESLMAKAAMNSHAPALYFDLIVFSVAWVGSCLEKVMLVVLNSVG
ncbi:hypothetical protein JHK82_031769 [Glycine max]|nr:hypothetical protein GLYMA_11G176312v4 [Glycine max]KAG4989443.1 hypothetical protein JHK85_032426 [Glycine max]KAG5125032.1 hypothetical protein JHK82_031769 [Glycine max]KAG5146457.1 hypothetical protein JHK84_032000 [Glycine max]KAH1140845.1 hypothetical protein GYH30_057228 [Glycine max]